MRLLCFEDCHNGDGIQNQDNGADMVTMVVVDRLLWSFLEAYWQQSRTYLGPVHRTIHSLKILSGFFAALLRKGLT